MVKQTGLGPGRQEAEQGNSVREEQTREIDCKDRPPETTRTQLRVCYTYAQCKEETKANKVETSH